MVPVSSAMAPSTASLRADFLRLLPKLKTHARIYFAYIVCPSQRADKIAETIALAWKWYLRLAERGKDASQFFMVFSFTIARAVKSGRRLCGQESARDVMSSVAQRRHDFSTQSLPSSVCRSHEELYSLVRGQDAIDAFEERLHSNTFTPPPDAAAFRIDFPRFLRRLSPRDREVAMFLSLGHGTKKAAHRFELTPGRVSQLRRQWEEEWCRFHGEDGPGYVATEGRKNHQ
jgi:hypothetical protein